MDTFWWRAAWGLCLVQLSLAQIDLNITCRYKGVFHVEKNGRYSISKTEAADLCKAFNCTLPTMAQMEAALRAGFETCRYGFIDGHVVIPRIHPNSICAANNTGVYILTSNTSQYDTYCFNASAPPEEDCTSVTDLPNAFEGPITITIVNRDGTRYTKKGEYRTNPDDINPSTTPEEDMSSGSSSERSTSGGYNIFHTHLPTVYPTPDQDSPWVPSNPETTPATITSTVPSNSHAAAQEQNNWIWPPFGNSQPKTQDQTTTTAVAALMSTSGTTSKTATKRQEAQDWFSWWFQPSATKIHLHTTTIMAAQPLMQVTTTGTDSNIISAGWEATEENEDESDRHPSYSGSDTDDDEDFISSTTRAPPTSTTEETATQKEQWFENGWPGEYPQMPKEDSHSTAGTTAASARDSHQNQRVTVQSQEDRSWTYFFDPVSHPMGRGHQTERRMDVDTSHSTTLQPSAGPNTGLVEDLDRTGPLSVTTQQSDTQSFSTSRGGLEEDKDHPMTATPTSSNRNDGTGGRRGENLPEDSTTSVEGYTPYSPDTNEYRTLIPVTPAKTGSPEVTIVGDSTSNVDLSLSEDQDSSHDPSGRSYTTHGSESAGHSSGSQERGANTTSGPMRKPQIPEWLIILASLLALALILAVCIAVNSRRRCGQKKKLVINSGNGTMEERKPSGLNGEASKSQEMVHLVNKESSETPDQFMTADERRNLQNVDMKIGV
ncbi:CD44 antigen isoform X7 [Phocoena sinus]|uniref:CD44 antigen isoform X7 n=1 Tax=Phocoena sinus TaxID=42100 RepID=UPI0013C4E674|nr:CD44 antigen isoform X7 [Phocoena sinus]